MSGVLGSTSKRAARAAAIAIGSALALATLLALAAPPKAPPKPPPPDAAGPKTTLKGAPRIARVRVDVTPGGAAITHDVIFPKDALTIAGPGEPTLFCAFTAQARPLAVEATKHALDASGALVEPGAKVEVIDVAVRPKTAALLLGPAAQAGHVVRLPRDGGPFALRVRSAIPTDELSAPTKRVELMLRLGVRDLAPMPVERIEVGAKFGATVRGARATFCGDGADPRPLTLVFPGYPSSTADAGTIVPTAASRTPKDDLCLEVLL